MDITSLMPFKSKVFFFTKEKFFFENSNIPLNYICSYIYCRLKRHTKYYNRVENY